VDGDDDAVKPFHDAGSGRRGGAKQGDGEENQAEKRVG
jgi:hypothetical protein